MTLVELLLVLLATARLVRLAQVDDITEPLRRPLMRRAKASKARRWELLWCPWCLSVWVGALVAGSWWAWGDERWWTAGVVVLVASEVTGILTETVDR